MTKKRLCIFVVYDKDGIIDDYIPYLLSALTKFVTHFIIVCNGILTDEGRDKLIKFTTELFVRENKGFDAGAIKDVLEKLYGWDRVLEYDELLISNDTFYGPLYPFDELFDKMEQEDCDFWGITEHLTGKKANIDYIIAAHLQSYFINFNFNLLHSNEMYKYWTELDCEDIIFKYDAVRTYEINMSQFFSNAGFRYKAYIGGEYFGNPDSIDNYDYSFIDFYKSINKYRCPILKRKACFSYDSTDLLGISSNEEKNKLLLLLERTGYDIDLIWDNLLRTANISAVKDALYLQYILPHNVATDNIMKDNAVVVIAHLYYDDLVDECLSYLYNVPEYYDVFITTSKDNIFRYVKSKSFNVRLVNNRGRDMSALLVGCNDLLLRYKYLCFVHDKKSTAHPRAGESFKYLIWENALGSNYYIENILDKFRKEPRLGFLSVPEPNASIFFHSIGDYWMGNFEITVKFLNDLDVFVPMDINESPFAIGNAFWCRTEAIKQLFQHNWTTNDFIEEPMPVDRTISHAIERSYPFIAQYNGYYSGIVMTDKYAEIRLSDMTKIITSLLSYAKIEQQKIAYSDFIGLKWRKDSRIIEFVKTHKKLYIYGIGEYGDHFAHIFEEQQFEVEFYIVSDGQPKRDTFHGRPVKFLSKVQFTNGAGVILAVSRDKQAQIKPNLDKAIESSGKKVDVYL